MRCAAPLGALCTVLLASCAVGPNFHRPKAPEGDYGSAQRELKMPVATGEGTKSQQLIVAGELPADWWTVFHSQALTDLVVESLKANPNAKAAQAALRQSQELYKAQRTSLWPSVQGEFDADRSKFATNSIANPTVSTSTTYSLYTAKLSLTYVPDLFGGTRRAIEASRAEVEVSRFQLEATYLTLASNVVVTAIQEASLRSQVAATERLLAVQHELTEKVSHQRELGTASNLDLLTQQTLEAQTASTLPPLRKQLAQSRDALTALLGRLPSGEPEAQFHLEDLTLPTEVPVSLPSQLVNQRPDVRQAEANLHVASAQVGVAMAQMLPQIALTGDIGSSGLSMGTLFKSGTGFWDVGASLSQTLFDAGALWHRYRAADAALDEAGEQYRAAVVTGCQNVADTLHALRADADALEASTKAERLSEQAFQLARQQRELGALSYVAVLSAEQLYQQALINRVQAEANRYSDVAALYQALGGGWWNKTPGDGQ